MIEKKVKYKEFYGDIIQEFVDKVKIQYYCKGKQEKTVLKSEIIIIGHGNKIIDNRG